MYALLVLTKTSYLATKYHVGPDWIVYRPDSEEKALVHITRFDFEDMGEPEVITVTVEPGDLLND